MAAVFLQARLVAYAEAKKYICMHCKLIIKVFSFNELNIYEINIYITIMTN